MEYLWGLVFLIFIVCVVFLSFGDTERYVLYYRPGCPACSQFMPRWNRLGIEAQIVNTMSTRPPKEVTHVPTLQITKGSQSRFVTGPQLQAWVHGREPQQP